MSIPKTIRNIYVDALVRKFKIKRKKNKIYVISELPKKYKPSFILKFFYEKQYRRTENIRTHILYAVGGKMRYGEPSPDKFHMDVMFKRTPTCDWAWCGENIEFGYRYCDKHRSLCSKCNKMEIDIRVDGISVCYECLRNGHANRKDNK